MFDWKHRISYKWLKITDQIQKQNKTNKENLEQIEHLHSENTLPPILDPKSKWDKV